MQCIKYTLFIINLLFAILGGAIIALGVIGLKISGSAGWAAIIFGAVVFFISFCGCCGAIQENCCMIITYQVFIVLLIIGGVAIAVPLFMYTENIKNALRDKLQAEFSTSKFQGSAIFSGIQQNLECCGFNGVSDYEGLHIPPSCCNTFTITCTFAKANKVGCHERFNKYLQTVLDVAAGIFAVYFCILVTLFISAVLLTKAILYNPKNRVYNHPMCQANTYPYRRILGF